MCDPVSLTVGAVAVGGGLAYMQGSKQAKMQQQAMDEAKAQAQRQAEEQKKMIASSGQKKKKPEAADILYGKDASGSTSLTGSTGDATATLAANKPLGS